MMRNQLFPAVVLAVNVWSTAGPGFHTLRPVSRRSMISVSSPELMGKTQKAHSLRSSTHPLLSLNLLLCPLRLRLPGAHWLPAVLV